MRGRVLLALCWLVCSAPVSAQEEAPRGPALHWVRLPGAESCIPASELAQRVEARLERRVFVLPQHAELAFEGFVQPRAAGGFSASLAVSNVRGQLLGARQLESPDANCRALDDALILITALTLFPNDFGLREGGIPLDQDTNARLQALFGDEPSELDPTALPAQPPPAQPVPLEVEPETVAAPEPAPALEPAAQRTRFAIEASPVAAIGVLPGIALALSAEVTLRLADLWPVRLGYAHFFERSERAEALPSGTGFFQRDELTLFACPISPDRPFAFELCAGGAFGILAVHSEGFAEGGIEASDPVADVGGQAGLRALFFDRLLARATVTALLPLVQRIYEYQGLDASTEPLFRSAQVGLRLQISAGLEF